MNYQEQLESNQELIREGEFSQELFENNIAFYESFIPEFFSKTGEANNIRKMYKDLRQEKNENKSISCISLTESATIYAEYIDGMTKFINDIKEIEITESTDDLVPFTEKFNNAKQNDSAFIESLFNGKLTEERDTVLTEAVSNVEFVIDFIDSIKDMKSRCNEIKESVNNDNQVKKELLQNCYNMLCESVNNYCFNVLKSVISTYNSINDSLYSENKKSEIKEEGFKLF